MKFTKFCVNSGYSICRYYSDKVTNIKKIPTKVINVNDIKGETSKIMYRPIDNKILRQERKEEYASRLPMEEYNEKIRQNREVIRDHYFSCSFDEFMRCRRYCKSPYDRVWTIFKDDIRKVLGTLDLYPTLRLDRNGYLVHEKYQPFEMCNDIVVIGGGMVGVSIAYHIKRLLETDINVTIIDKDFSYRNSATSLSIGGLKQQFSVKENIELSRYGALFLDNVKEELSFKGHTPDIGFNYSGFLTLADKGQFEQLEENFELMREQDVEAKFLIKKDLQLYFPWMQTDTFEGGILGMEQEGWFDHLSLLDSLHRKCAYLGTDYITGDVVDCDSEQMETEVRSHNLDTEATRIMSVKVRLPCGRKVSVKCGILVLAAGMDTPELGKLFEIGTVDNEKSIFSKKLPIFKKRHFVYKIYVPNGPGLNCPVILNPSGLLFRREGLDSIYICQAAPSTEIGSDSQSINDYFMKYISPELQNLSKSFKNLKIQHSYEAFSDYNEFDNNPIIGFHRGVVNLFIASGFNNSSFHALGVGNYFAEKILCQDLTIDLKCYSPDRYLCSLNPVLTAIQENCIH